MTQVFQKIMDNATIIDTNNADVENDTVSEMGARTEFSSSSSLGYVSADGVEQLRDLLDDDEEIVETPLVVKEPGSQIVDGLSEARMSSKAAAPPKPGM